MSGAISLIKISGHYLDDEALLRRFAEAVAEREEPLVIVHGGGIEITRLQEGLNIEPTYVDGLRVTDARSLSLVEMALCGSVNKRLVRHLLNAGVDAQGLSGVDRGLVRARQMRHESVDMQAYRLCRVRAGRSPVSIAGPGRDACDCAGQRRHGQQLQSECGYGLWSAGNGARGREASFSSPMSPAF